VTENSVIVGIVIGEIPRGPWTDGAVEMSHISCDGLKAKGVCRGNRLMAAIVFVLKPRDKFFFEETEFRPSRISRKSESITYHVTVFGLDVQKGLKDACYMGIKGWEEIASVVVRGIVCIRSGSGVDAEVVRHRATGVITAVSLEGCGIVRTTPLSLKRRCCRNTVVVETPLLSKRCCR